MRKFLFSLFYLIPLLFIQGFAFAQVTISGPVCVVQGTTYQYYIHGAWDSVSSMQVCITGGKITDSSASSGCTVHSAPLGSVSVTWNTTGSLTVTSSKGNVSLTIAITTALQGGALDSTIRAQTFVSVSAISVITCSPASGGSCTPVYAYQWQESSDAISWSDMSGATVQNLKLSSPLTETTYFRRRVTETFSGTIGYSDVALVDVGAPAPAAHSFNNKMKINANSELAYNNR